MPINHSKMIPPMEKLLKTSFPEDVFDVKETPEKFTATKKKRGLRLYKTQLARLEKLADTGETLSQTIVRIVATMPVSPTEFEITQIPVTLEASNAVKNAAERCGTRHLMYLEKLLG